MSKIRRADYEIIATQAKKIREHGKQLNSEIIKVYSNLESMHEFWYGKRYNTLLKVFNTIIPQVNEMLEIVVGKLPYVLELIANNYSKVDIGQNETVADNTKPNRIKELVITNDEGMRFLSGKVIDMQEEISKCFERAKYEMNQIEIEYSKILWESESSELFKQKYCQLKNAIIVLLENVDVEFKKLMAQTENNIEGAEKNNTVE